MVAITLILLVAAIHIWIVVLEMVLWTAPAGRRVFATTEVFASQTKVLAANQGLYNGFLVAALIWALVAGVSGPGWQMAVYGLSCVIVAGLYGAATVSRRVLFVQALPAALALAALLAGI
ncbi:DUF1304 domain-containing protein [Neotabrizicola sp. VNH66]|uniref:DUF1304 domain-containing protein n=1 Tax=Neotabrizicola sp. VNH66 TaxID=3400918 RepID=UPI003C01DC34